MRIAHVTATFPPYWGGTGNVCYYNARELSRQGHEVHVFTASVQGAPAEENMQGVFVHRLKPLFQFGNAPFLPGLLRLRDFDLIHLHHPFIFGAEIIRFISKLLDMPYVLTHHNDLIGIGFRHGLFQLYSGISSRGVFNDARCLIPVSMDYAKSSQLADLFNKHPNIVEVPNGIDPEVFQPMSVRQKIRNSLKIRPEVPLINFVAALDRAHHFKGLDILIEALSRPNFERVHLLVAGDGDMKAYYQSLAGLKNMEERVRFVGSVNHNKLPAYLCAGDFLVLPSSPPESFGLVVVEAMACGLPVIASNIPGVRGVVSDGVDGYLFHPNDVDDLAEKISLMLALPEEERRAMGARDREKVLEKYTWAHAAEMLEKIYFIILNSKVL